MSNSIWDWWFGDGPLQHAAPSHPTTEQNFSRRRERRAMRRLISWVNGIAVRRRLFVFLGVAGASSTFSIGWATADDNLIEVPVRAASFGWAPTLSFNMIEADEVDPTEQVNDESLNEDEQRRKRLRDLLGDDADISLGGDKQRGSDPNSDVADLDERDRDTSMNDEDGVFSEPFIEDRLPEVEGGRFVLPPLRAVSIDQKPIGNGRVPETYNAGDELPLVALPEDGYGRLVLTNGGAWPQLIRPWAAPNTFSHPLYFEDRMLERHGHERWGCFQPLAAGTRFFVTLPMLPYLATVQEPCDIVYSKGYYRAGSPVPKFYQRPPLERRAVIVEAAAVSGAFIALP